MLSNLAGECCYDLYLFSGIQQKPLHPQSNILKKRVILQKGEQTLQE